jgi:hypothetical protein
MMGIDFIHAHKLAYHIISRQVNFAGANANAIVAIKQTVLPVMASTVFSARFKGKPNPKAT